MRNAGIHANSPLEVHRMYNAVGIDVSKNKSTIAILQPGGTIIRKPFNVSHTDARKIARYTLDNWTELRQYSGMDNTRTQLKTLNSQFSFFMKQTVAAKANLIALLDNTYPGVNKLFNSPPREDGSEKWVDYAYSFWHVERLQIYPQGSTNRLCMR